MVLHNLKAVRCQYQYRQFEWLAINLVQTLQETRASNPKSIIWFYPSGWKPHPSSSDLKYVVECSSFFSVCQAVPVWPSYWRHTQALTAVSLGVTMPPHWLPSQVEKDCSPTFSRQQTQSLLKALLFLEQRPFFFKHNCGQIWDFDQTP